MASLIRYRTGIYYIIYCQKSRRIWRSLRTRDRVEAHRRFADAFSVDPTRIKGTLCDAEAEFLSFVKTNYSPKTLECCERTFKNLRNHFGARWIQELSQRDVEQYKSVRVSTVSAFTVNQELRCLRAFFNRLLEWKLVTANPCASVKDIRVPDSVPAYLSKDDLLRLLQHTGEDPLREIILFTAMTGLRRAEVCNLKWSDVDLQRGAISIRSSESYRTKAGKARIVPTNSTVRELLAKCQSRSGYVFPGKRGGKNNGNFLRAQLKKAVVASGLDPSLHFHSLRHTFASMLVAEGVSLYHVQTLLGHSSPRVTQTYAHLGPAELLASVEKIRLGTNFSATPADRRQ